MMARNPIILLKLQPVDTTTESHLKFNREISEPAQSRMLRIEKMMKIVKPTAFICSIAQQKSRKSSTIELISFQRKKGKKNTKKKRQRKRTGGFSVWEVYSIRAKQEAKRLTVITRKIHQGTIAAQSSIHWRVSLAADKSLGAIGTALPTSPSQQSATISTPPG